MKWTKDKSALFRATVVFDSDFTLAKLSVAMAEAVKWCRNNNIMMWNDTSLTIRFSKERDLTLFLLRWA